jgi:hypothetical protein
LIGSWIARLISIPATFLVGGIVIILASAGVLRLPKDGTSVRQK